jgi:hypothetical protein
LSGVRIESIIKRLEEILARGVTGRQRRKRVAIASSGR